MPGSSGGTQKPKCASAKLRADAARVSSLWVQNLGVLRDALASLAGLRKKQCRIYWMTAPLQLPRMDAFYRAKRPNPKAPPMPMADEEMEQQQPSGHRRLLLLRHGQA